MNSYKKSVRSADLKVKNYDTLAKTGSSKIPFSPKSDSGMAMDEHGNISVVKNKENPEPVEIIAESIIEISRGMRRLRSGKLNMNALLVLIQASTKLSQRNIIKVLNALESLEKMYVNIPKT